MRERERERERERWHQAPKALKVALKPVLDKDKQQWTKKCLLSFLQSKISYLHFLIFVSINKEVERLSVGKIASIGDQSFRQSKMAENWKFATVLAKTKKLKIIFAISNKIPKKSSIFRSVTE